MGGICPACEQLVPGGTTAVYMVIYALTLPELSPFTVTNSASVVPTYYVAVVPEVGWCRNKAYNKLNGQKAIN